MHFRHGQRVSSAPHCPDGIPLHFFSCSAMIFHVLIFPQPFSHWNTFDGLTSQMSRCCFTSPSVPPNKLQTSHTTFAQTFSCSMTSLKRPAKPQRFSQTFGMRVQLRQ